ncbi:MAG: hypothetical protein ACOYM3_07810 [Terrimicrobiaceae bacterium]
MKTLAIIGSALSGGAEQIIDALAGGDLFGEILLFDNDLSAIGTEIMGAYVVDSSANILEWHRKNRFDCAVIGIGRVEEREKIFQHLSGEGVAFTNIIDKAANIRPSVSMGAGNVILANVYLGPSVIIGDNNYIITNTHINHHSIIGSHCYFSSGCTLAGRVHVGNKVRFDTASGSKADIKIHDETTVPAGKILV